MGFKYSFTARKKEMISSIRYIKDIEGKILDVENFLINDLSISTDGDGSFLIYHYFEDPRYPNRNYRWYNTRFNLDNLVIEKCNNIFFLNIEVDSKKFDIEIIFTEKGIERIFQWMAKNIPLKCKNNI